MKFNISREKEEKKRKIVRKNKIAYIQRKVLPSIRKISTKSAKESYVVGNIRRKMTAWWTLEIESVKRK